MEKWEKLKKLSEKSLKELQLSEMRKFFCTEIVTWHHYYRKLFQEIGFTPDKITKLEDIEVLPYTQLNNLAEKKVDDQRLTRFVIEPGAEKSAKKEPEKKKSFWGKIFQTSTPIQTNKNNYNITQVFYSSDFKSSPTPLAFTVYDIERIKEAGNRLFNLWGLTRDDTMVNALSYAPNLAFWQVFYGGLEEGSTVLQSGGGRILGTEKILTALENMEAEVLFASPLYACHLLQTIIKFNVNVKSLTTIVLGLESPSREMVSRLKELMSLAGTAGTQVIRSFSLTEAKTGWGECPEGDGYHFHPDLHYIEIINPETGKKLQENEGGEIVITHLDTRGTCLIRYRTGFLITEGLTYTPCPVCGSSVPRLMGEIESSKNIVRMETEKGQERIINLEKLTRRLDKEKNLLLWQGVLTNDRNPSLTIYSSCLNKDDTYISSLTEEISENTGLNVNFIGESYGSVMDRLRLETAYIASRWIIETK